ncbi:MAG: hypothetical protein RIS44_1459 [Pseudomonadota bacterium]|jgi:hypothetical protein
MNTSLLSCRLPLLGRPRREFAPAWRVTFFAGAKKVTKETPITSLFERSGLNHLTRLRRVVRLGATSIYCDVKGLFFPQECSATTVIPAKAGMTNKEVHTMREVRSRRDQPKTWPERQWLRTESIPHVCAPAPSHPSPNRLVFRCFLGDFFCTSKRSYSAAGPNTRRGAPPVGQTKRRQATRLMQTQGALTWTA